MNYFIKWGGNILLCNDTKINKIHFKIVRALQQQSKSAKYNYWGFPGGPMVRSLLTMQETLVWSLIWEDPTCCRATKLLHRNYWRSRSLKPTLCSQRSHRNTAGEQPHSTTLVVSTRGSLSTAAETQHSQRELSKSKNKTQLSHHSQISSQK